MLGMGIDSATADRLIENGFNAKSLKTLPETGLRDLGLTQSQIENVIGAGRTPIPEDILNTVLFKSKWVCCICRDPKKAVIVHHLSPWAKSRSHALDNLVILCLEHHGEAHTIHQLALNLTPDRIKNARDRWYALAEASNHNEANRLADLIADDHRLFSVHRGVKAWGVDTAIIFGNDSPSEPRTLLEIQNVRRELQAKSIDELGFATSAQDQTWVLLAASNNYRLLEEITWKAFWSAYESLHQGAASNQS
ncbi:hypothetical protein NL30_15250 [Burkholderia contaminans]|nr:hypothetical protein NL30_15250 [Burkholderia contaminans]